MDVYQMLLGDLHSITVAKIQVMAVIISEELELPFMAHLVSLKKELLELAL
jgi:hypothetical protein